jgi:hypothetical protein
MANSGLVVDAIKGFIDPNEKQLLNQIILQSRTPSLLTQQFDVKTNTHLNILHTNPTLQAGGCGWNPEGTSTVTSRTISAHLMKINMPYCDKDLIDTFMKYPLRIAAGNAILPFEQEFINGVLVNLGKQIDNLCWQGDTDIVGGYLNLSDGLIKIITGETDCTQISFGAITPSNAKSIIDGIYLGIPADTLDVTTIFCGYDTLRSYQVALTNANLYHYAPSTDTDGMVYPGSSIRIEAVSGLNATNFVCAMPRQHAFYGCDMANDREKVDFWYSLDNQQFRLAVDFTQGVQIAYPEEVVYHSLTEKA